MKKHAIQHWPIGAVLLFLAVSITGGVLLHSRSVDAAATNVIGLQLSDGGCGNNTAQPGYASDIGKWTPWTGDDDSYDPDCIRLYLGNTIPADTDIRIGVQARDVNTPCGFLWLFKCGDGGGTVAYGPWVGDSTGTGYSNTWTGWATNVAGWDPDQVRFIVSSRPRYGLTINDFKMGLQVGDVSTNSAGCNGQIGTARYTASSTAGASWTSWAADNVDNQNFNCVRINLVATSTLNAPTAVFTGTSTAPYGTSVNLPWDVEYINTTTGCTLTSPSDPVVRKIYANGAGSTTTIPITGNTTYTLNCPGFKSGTSASAVKTIGTIAQPASLAFSMSPITGLNAGDTSTASISAINASSCTLVGKDLNGAVVDSGFTYVPPPPSQYTGSMVQETIAITAGSSWVVPGDWNSSSNSIEVLGGGGNGGKQGNSIPTGGAGGGGGGYAAVYNISLTPGATISYNVDTNGGGGSTWFRDTSTVAADGGDNGANYGSCNNCGGGDGGAGTAGSVLYSGGKGGGHYQYAGGGGAGAAGPNGNGSNGSNANGATSGGKGGGSDAGNGGSGGGGSSSGCCHNAGAGGAGSEWTVGKKWDGTSYTTGPFTLGSGGGGGGGADCGQANCNYPGYGGQYGGGGGGDGDDSYSTGGRAGGDGIIIITYSHPVYTTKTIILTSGSTWTVPSDWNPSYNTIEVIGGGGGGGGGSDSTTGGKGGAGGVYAKVSNASLTRGASVGYNIGAGGTGGGVGVNGGDGGNTYFCNSTSNCASIAGSAVVVAGTGGGGGPIGSGNGTIKSGSIGGVINVGGWGGNGLKTPTGGGGAGGPIGAGGGGGAGNTPAAPSGGGGNGGGSTAPTSGSAATAGGDNAAGVGAGAAGTSSSHPGGNGSNGGGGGGAYGTGASGTGFGGLGGAGTEWDSTHGSGGGGGGSGGAGGLYGGGGGGGSNTTTAYSSGGAGAKGLIVITYSITSLADNTDVHTSTHTINGTTDYSVDCTGFDGVHVVKTVRVNLSACSLDGVTIPNGSSANFYSQSTPPAGHTCSEYGPAARSCSGGTLDTANAAYKYASCLDQSGISIKANNISAVTSVRKGSQIALTWDGGNATSCSVTGTDGFTGADADGTTPITAARQVFVNQKTVYTLSCSLGASTKQATVTVGILPTIKEN